MFLNSRPFRVLRQSGYQSLYSTNISNITQTHLASLPPIPSRPTTTPTPWLSPEEIEAYLFPLVEIIPWRFLSKKGRLAEFISRRKDDKRAMMIMQGLSANSKHSWNGLLYFASYDFTTPAAAAEFLVGISEIAKEEEHEPLFLRLHTDAHPRVYIELTTRDAYIPKEVADLRVKRKPNIPIPETLVTPGLTLRDVRLAMLMDGFFRERFLFGSQTGIFRMPVKTEESRQRDPLTAKDVIREVFQKRYWEQYIKHVTAQIQIKHVTAQIQKNES